VSGGYDNAAYAKAASVSGGTEQSAYLEEQSLSGDSTSAPLIAALQAKLASVTVSGNDVTFSGVNVHIVSGSGSTSGPTNGLGNLIIGYNETRNDGTDDRSGSHNLIVGTGNNYSLYGGLVAGAGNTVSGGYASVCGGTGNVAGAGFASVSGGSHNTASSFASSVSGGSNNSASDYYASVSGGSNNSASGSYASVSGGSNNSASGISASVSGGSGQFALAGQSISADSTQVAALQTKLASLSVTGNDVTFSGVNVHIVSGSGSTSGPTNGLGNLIIGYNETRGIGLDDRTGSHNLIVGMENNYSLYGGLVAGTNNTISGPFASVCGGYGNLASATRASVSGGFNNTASGLFASVSGGGYNTASELYASVSGGAYNTASGGASSVSGGESNMASANESTVGGGNGTLADTQYEWAAGTLRAN
jgi:hypothetical protein